VLFAFFPDSVMKAELTETLWAICIIIARETWMRSSVFPVVVTDSLREQPCLLPALLCTEREELTENVTNKTVENFEHSVGPEAFEYQD